MILQGLKLSEFQTRRTKPTSRATPKSKTSPIFILCCCHTNQILFSQSGLEAKQRKPFAFKALLYHYEKLLKSIRRALY